MLKTIKHTLITGMLIGALTPLFASCPVNVTNPQINAKPLTYPGEGHISFTVVKNGGREVPASDSYGEPTCEMNVEMSYVTLKDTDIVNVTGDITQYFDVTFNASQNRVYFKQKADIPVDLEIPADIRIDVTQESSREESFNGFQLNVYASSVEGSDFTYTEAIVPDYRPTVILNGSPITGVSGEVTLIVKVGEFNGALNTSAVKIFIPNNASIVLNFNQEDTEVAGEVVSNSEWKLTEISSGYLFEYKGNNGKYPVQERRNIGLTGVYTSGTKQAGNVTVEATILTGNGESIISNNKDTSTLSFNNIN